MRPNGMSERSYDAVMRSPWRACLLRGRPEGERVFALITLAIRAADSRDALAWREKLIANGTIIPLQSRPTYRTDHAGRKAAAADIQAQGADFAAEVAEDFDNTDPEITKLLLGKDWGYVEA